MRRPARRSRSIAGSAREHGAAPVLTAEWAFLEDAEPSHVTPAKGSAVSITPAVDVESLLRRIGTKRC